MQKALRPSKSIKSIGKHSAKKFLDPINLRNEMRHDGFWRQWMIISRQSYILDNANQASIQGINFSVLEHYSMSSCGK